ncbi:hypothetical protein [Streptomyces sp. NPDC013455]|uniref:hypothetical protein n=1 Tax=Streptomyces sp. NPDC013455 TaxID=3155605 RepID=UPI0033D174FF
MDVPDDLVKAKTRVERDLLALPGVTGMGIGLREEGGELLDELAVRVQVDHPRHITEEIPDEIGGLPVSVIVREIQPCVAPDTLRYGDLPGGVMVRNPLVAEGTMGAVVEDAHTAELFGLTCYHVAGGPENDFPHTVWQPVNPPLVVGSTVPRTDHLGRVDRVDVPRTPPLPGSPVLVGLVDAAVFRLDDATSNGRTLSRRIVGRTPGGADLIAKVTATARSSVTQPVRKRGSQTLLTFGRVIANFWTVQWSAGASNTWLIDQAEILADDPRPAEDINPDGIFARPGDSGSLVLDATQPTAVGLLWGANKAGEFGSVEGRIGMMSEIVNVEAQLGVTVPV